MMRRAAVVLALLLCLQWTWAQTDGENKNAEVLFESRGAKATPDHSRTNVTPDIWAELKELRHKMEKLEQENAGAARIHATFITGINYFRELSIASLFVLCVNRIHARDYFFFSSSRVNVCTLCLSTGIKVSKYT